MTGRILIVVDIMQDSVKRQAVGIWKCSSCKKVIAGGAWTVSTTAAATVRRYVPCRHVLFEHRGSCPAPAPSVGSGRSRRRNLAGSRFMLCFPLPSTHIYVPRYEHHQYSLMPPVYSTMTITSTNVDRNSKLEALCDYTNGSDIHVQDKLHDDRWTTDTTV